MDRVLHRILHIDDDAVFQGIAQMCFDRAEADFVIEGALSGPEIVDVAERFMPDLILLDYHMPIMNGPETLVALRNAAATAKIPVIFLSGDEGVQDELEAQQGVIGFIPKPFCIKGFVQTVENMWHGSEEL